MEPPQSLPPNGVTDEAMEEDDNPGQGRDANSTPKRKPSFHVKSTPIPKTRSLSDSQGTPSKLSPSPFILEAGKKMSKDDSSVGNVQPLGPPATPRRTNQATAPGGLALQMPARDFTPPPLSVTGSQNSFNKAPPLSPKLDHSHIYSSPTNILPRRSRGLDYTRAATSLHHSTLAEQSSPESSPTVGVSRAMSISSRRSENVGPEQTSNSLWSVMGNQERMHVSSSLGSNNYAVGSGSSSSSDDDDLMDEDMDEPIISTPQVTRSSSSINGTLGSPAMGSLMSFQQRQRQRRQPKKKLRGQLGLGFNNSATQPRSPPNGRRSRRESISWQANQLHISGMDGEEAGKSDGDGAEGQMGVIRRAVTRRGNMLPKTKTFARIRAALMEEGAPAEAETHREAEVIKQVRESDVDERRVPPSLSGQDSVDSTVVGDPSPSLRDDIDINDIPGEHMMDELSSGLSNSFKQHALKNSKGKNFWENFSEPSSATGQVSTPPSAAFLARGSSSGISDTGMDSPAGATGPSQSASNGSQTPSVAEITRKINNKRRREDDLDLTSLKRRAVSPSLSINSPVIQSPLQRDVAPWGSRPGSNGGDRDRDKGSRAPSENGSISGQGGQQQAMSSSSAPGGNGRTGSGSGSKGRVGFQGMVDTNDGIMRMSIE